jgi:hypothetical protein
VRNIVLVLDLCKLSIDSLRYSPGKGVHLLLNSSLGQVGRKGIVHLAGGLAGNFAQHTNQCVIILGAVLKTQADAGQSWQG